MYITPKYLIISILILWLFFKTSAKFEIIFLIIFKRCAFCMYFFCKFLFVFQHKMYHYVKFKFINSSITVGRRGFYKVFKAVVYLFYYTIIKRY